ncbi:hypothetical protein PM082_001481 [Marasmius tenuissimus]|nr:hypothetical protein PM082_001481 [Marasmius tenuissimus]
MRKPVLSLNGTFRVVDYSPQEGEGGVPITVRIHFHQDSPNAIFVRLVVGGRPVPTRVEELPGVKFAKWKLHATVPVLDPSSTLESVSLEIQALDQSSRVLDLANAGNFSYWLSDRSNYPSPNSESGGVSSSHRRQVSLDVSQATPSTTTSNSPVLRRRAATTSGARPIIASHAALASSSNPLTVHSKSRPLKGGGPYRIRANSLARSKLASSKELGANLRPHEPIVTFKKSLLDACLNWDQAEMRAGRRLVRLTKRQNGRETEIDWDPVAQEDYHDSACVISCIFRDETDAFYVTSVDVIYLLERLTDSEFPVEEKNRVRRNLEVLRPTTVSKHKAGFERFFQRIMEFPDPKPRNIEKDLKVFEWRLLGEALQKIFKKYSWYTQSSPTSSSASLPSEPTEEHPPYQGHLVRYANSQLVPKLAQPTPLIPKFEPSFNDRSILLLSSHEGTPDGGIPHPSKHAFDTLQHYPLYPSDTNPTLSDHSSTHEDSASFNNWADTGAPGDMALESYHTLSGFQLAEAPVSQNTNGIMPHDEPDYHYSYPTESNQYPKETPAYYA